MLGVGVLVASAALFPRRQSGPLTLRGDLSDGVHTVKLSSAIVPRDVVRMAAQRSGVLTKGGGVPSAAAVSAFAQRINAWYRENGYVLARVQGCRPVAAGRLELEAFEPRVARQPVRIEFYAPAVEEEAPAEPAAASTTASTTRSASSWLPRPPAFARRMAAAAAIEWSLVPRPGASDAGASRALERAQRAGVTKTVLARGAARRRAPFTLTLPLRLSLRLNLSLALALSLSLRLRLTLTLTLTLALTLTRRSRR